MKKCDYFFLYGNKESLQDLLKQYHSHQVVSNLYIVCHSGNGQNPDGTALYVEQILGTISLVFFGELEKLHAQKDLKVFLLIQPNDLNYGSFLIYIFDDIL